MTCSNSHQSIYFSDNGSSLACGNCGHIWVCCGTYLGSTCGGQCRLLPGSLPALPAGGGQTLSAPLYTTSADAILGDDEAP